MYDKELLVERLTTVLEALERIPRRCAGIVTPSDFSDSPEGVDRMDAICMVLLAVGEELKSIDRKTEGRLLSRYPEMDWRGVVGVWDGFAQAYFRVNAEQLLSICKDDVPVLIDAVRRMIDDLTDPGVLPRAGSGEGEG